MRKSAFCLVLGLSMAACGSEEEDPFLSSPAESVSAEDIAGWDETRAWGNHADAGYVTSESDPTFQASAASQITESDLDLWNSVVELNEAGFLDSESDPAFVASPVAAVQEQDLANWDSAFAWGDHAVAGYLQAETDPAFAASPVAAISSMQVASWNVTAAWGNHALAGYLQAESDPSFVASAASAIGATEVTSWNEAAAWGNHALVGYLTEESDPAFAASFASAITATEIASWNQTASWGDHAAAGYLDAETDPAFAASPAAAISNDHIGSWETAVLWGDHAAAGYLTAESDPAFVASAAASISSEQVSSWDLAAAQGDHAAVGYLTGESDPVFSASAASSITAGDLERWNAAEQRGDHASAGYLTEETDPKIGSLADASVPRWNGTELVAGTLQDFGTGVGIGMPPVADDRLSIGDPTSEVYVARQTRSDGGSGGKNQYQSFVPNTTGRLVRFRFRGGCGSDPSLPLTARLELMNGRILDSVSMTIAATRCETWYNVQFPTAPLVQAGVQYRVRLITPRSLNTSSSSVQDRYTAGHYYSDVYGTPNKWDMMFDAIVQTEPEMTVTADGRVGVGASNPSRSVHANGVIRLEPLYVAPADPAPGDLYFDGNSDQLRYFDGSAWVSL